MHVEEEIKPLVDFVVIGAQKAGTTTLFDALKRHPELAGSTPKELNFFSTSCDWHAEIDRYHQSFSDTGATKQFEGSTSYAFAPLNNLCVWRDIHAYNPNMRFIYSVRDPIDRIVSSYMMYYEKGFTDLSLPEAVIQDRHYIDACRYASQIAPYISQFGANNILLLNFDEITQDLESTLKKIAVFLDIDPIGFPSSPSVHANKSLGSKRLHRRFHNPNLMLRAIRRWSPPLWRVITKNSDRSFTQKPHMPIDLQQTVIDLLEPDIQQIENTFGWDLSSWRALRPK